MKKLSKEQIEKRKKIKQLLLRSLNIVCYVLSALFIVVCFAVGVQSCKGKQSNSRVVDKFNNNFGLVDTYSGDFAYSYISKYYGNHTLLGFDTQEQLLKMCDSSLSISTEYQTRPSYTWSYNLNEVYGYDQSGNRFVGINQVFCEYAGFSRYGNGNDYYLRLTQIYFNTDLGGIGYALKTTQDQDGRGYNDSYYNFDWVWQGQTIFTKFYGSQAIVDNPIFNIFFSVTSLDITNNYYLPTTLNYYYWVDQKPNAIFGASTKGLDIVQSTNFSDSSQIYRIILNVPYFKSNGRLYNQIILDYLCLEYGGNTKNFYTDKGGDVYSYTYFSATQLHNWGLFESMSYGLNFSISDLNSFDVAYQRRYITVPGVNNTSPVTCITSECQWNLDSYRNIQFLANFDPNDSNKTTFELLTKISISPDSYPNVYTQLFDLLGLAFSSLTSIFNIQVMPMLSIGVLLFAPLLFGIIVIIFRMVKK